MFTGIGKAFFFPGTRIATVILACLFSVLVMGCSPLTQTYSGVVDQPENFSVSGTEPIPDQWWKVFKDEQLNTWIDEALRSNLTLKTAWSRLTATLAVVDRETAGLFPDLDGFADARITRNDTTHTEEFEIGLMSDYEIDLWGRIRAGIDSDVYEAEATLFDYQTASLTLSAEVVRTWYQFIEAHNQLDLVKQQVDTNEKILKLLESRFHSGQVRRADILRQEQLLESTRQQIYTSESEIKVLQHRLAVLLGRPPRETITYREKDLPLLPALPETGLPAGLLRRRPDVQASFARLKAADREVAAAISDRFPRINLSLSFSSEDDASLDLFDNWARSFAGSVAAPLLDAGRRRAEVERARSVKDQRLYEYGQAILTAFQEVEDALVLESRQSLQIESLEKQVRLARQTNERLQYEYFNGAGQYIDVLTSLTNEQQLRRELLSAKLSLLEIRITLYRSLAGGFLTEREVEYES